MPWRASPSYDSYDALGQFGEHERRFSVAQDGTISRSKGVLLSNLFMVAHLHYQLR